MAEGAHQKKTFVCGCLFGASVYFIHSVGPGSMLELNFLQIRKARPFSTLLNNLLPIHG
jgi:hypothetical protein